MNNEMTPNKEQQLAWIKQALILDGFEELNFPAMTYKKEIKKEVYVMINLKEKLEPFFMVVGNRIDEDDEAGTLAKVATLIVEAMTGAQPTRKDSEEVIGDVPPVEEPVTYDHSVQNETEKMKDDGPSENAVPDIQKPAKNINSDAESVKNDDSVVSNMPTVHKAPVKMTQFTPTGTMIKNMQFGLKEIGAIKIGGPGEEKQGKNGPYRLPVKFDHFLVNTKHKDAQGNFIPDAAIMEAIGQDAKEIDVCLLYNDPTLNFYTQYNEYKGGKRMCSGDGEHATKEDGTKLICDPDTCPTFKAKKCKANGILSVVLPDAPRLGGVYKFRTTSFNSIRSILSSMFFLQSLTGGVLANIPLKLTVAPQSVNPVSSPTAQTIYVVNLEYAGTVDDLHKQTVALMTERATMQHKIAELESQARAALSVPESAEEIQDVQAEFYTEVEE
jgi:hypothetical protein